MGQAHGTAPADGPAAGLPLATGSPPVTGLNPTEGSGKIILPPHPKEGLRQHLGGRHNSPRGRWKDGEGDRGGSQKA